MADDGGKDILQLHFGIDIRDAETKINSIKDSLANIVDFGKLKHQIRTASQMLQQAELGLSSSKNAQSPLDNYLEKIREFRRGIERIRQDAYAVPRHVTKEMSDAADAMTKSANAFEEAYKRLFGAASIGAVASIPVDEKATKNLGMQVEMTTKLADAAREAQVHLSALVKDIQSGYSQDDATNLSKRLFASLQEFQSLQNNARQDKIKLSIDIDNIVAQLKTAMDVFGKSGKFPNAYMNYMKVAMKAVQETVGSSTDLRFPTRSAGFGINDAIEKSSLEDLSHSLVKIAKVKNALKSIFKNGAEDIIGDTDSDELASFYEDFTALPIMQLLKRIKEEYDNGAKEIPKSIENAAVRINNALKKLYDITVQVYPDVSRNALSKDIKIQTGVRAEEYFNTLLRRNQDTYSNAVHAFNKALTIEADNPKYQIYYDSIRKIIEQLANDGARGAKNIGEAFSKMFLTINKESNPELYEGLNGLFSLELSGKDIGAIANIGKTQDAAKAIASIAESAKQAGALTSGGFAGVIPMLNGLAVAVNAIPGDGGTKISGLASSITKLKDAMSGLGNTDTIDLGEYVRKIRDAFAGISADGKQSPYTLPAPTIAPVSDENIARYVADSISKIRSAFEGGKQDGSEAKSISVPVNFNTDKSITDLNSRIQSVRDMLAGNPIKVKVTLDTAQYAAELQNTDLTTPAENAASLKAREDLLKGVALPVTSVNVATVKKAIGIATLNRDYTLLENVSIPVTTISVARVKKATGSESLSDNFRLLADISIPVSNLDFGRVTSVFNTDKLGPTYLANVALPVTSIDVSTVTKVKGKSVLKKNDALLADVAIKAPTIGAIDTKPLDTLREKITWLNENPLNMSLVWLSDENLNRVKEFAQAIREVASSLKYLQDLEKTLEKIGAEQNAALKNMAKKKGTGELSSKTIKMASQFEQDSFIRGHERTKKLFEDAQARAEHEVYTDITNFVQIPYNAYTEVKAKLDKLYAMPWEGGDESRLSKAMVQARVQARLLYDANAESRTKAEIENEEKHYKKLRRIHDAAEGTSDSIARYNKALSNTNLALNSQPNLAPYTKSLQEMRKSYNDMIQSIRNGNIGAIGGGMNIAGLDVTALKRLQAEMRTTGDSFTEMMRTMGFYITGRSVITFFQNAIKSASQFSMEIRRIQSLATTFDFERIKTGLESLDARFGNLIHNAKALYWAFSSGVRGTEEELVRFTETMSKTAITIGSDVMPVMDAATTLMNAYGKSAASAGEISDLLFTIVKEGKANGQQLASSIGNIIAPASAMGLTFKDIGATISTLTRTMKTNNALTYLNNILAKMNNPTKEVQSQLDKLGLEINATAIKAKGFAQVMREIHEATRGDINLIAKIFPDIRGQRAAVTLFSTQFGEFQKQLENFGNMAGNMDEALAKITDNPEAQFAALRNGFEMIRQAAGDAAINVITFGGALTPIFSAVNGMKSFGRSVAGHIAGIAALGVVMNMLGKAKLMLESANISSIQQMNLAYVEQTSLIAQSIMSKREQIAAEEANKAAAMETWHAEQLANNATYADIKDKIELLSVQEKLVKQRKVELDLQLAILKKDADAVKFAEDRWVTQQKQVLAYERLKGANDAARGIPIQWAMQDQLKEARALVSEWNKETRLLGYQSGLKTGDLNSIVAKAMTEAVNGGAEPEIIKQIEAAAKQAKINIERTLLERIVAGVRMEHQVSVMNRDFNEIIKNGDLANNPNAFSSLALKMNTLNADILNRFQVAVQTEADLRKLYTSHGMSEAEANARIENLNNELNIIRELAQAEKDRAEIEMSAGGAAYKLQLDASKARAQSMASEYKLHEKNMQDIISETDARVKNAAAQRDAAKAEAEAMRGRQRLNDYIVQNNLQLGKEKTKLDELIQSYRQLEALQKQWQANPIAKGLQMDQKALSAMAERIAQQRYLQLGQFNNESGAWRGAWAAANAAAQNASVPNFLNKLSFLPGVGGAVGMFVRPFSMFYKEIAKGSGLLAQAAMKALKWTAAITTNNAVIGQAIAQQRKLTAIQALANTSVSKYVGVIMSAKMMPRTIADMRAFVTAAHSIGLSAKGLQSAMLITTGSFAAAAVALGAVLWWANSKWDNSPFVKWMGKLTDLDRQLERSKGLDKLFDIAKQNIARKNEYEQRFNLLREETDYSMKAYDAMSRLNGVEQDMLAVRQEQLGKYTGEFSYGAIRMNENVKKANKRYDELAAEEERVERERNKVALWVHQQRKDRLLTRGGPSLGSIADGRKRLRELNERLDAIRESVASAYSELEEAKSKAMMLPPRLVAVVETYEMMNEIEMNRMDILSSEATNAMRAALLAKKRNDTERRIASLLDGKSDETRMAELANQTSAAYNKHVEAERKLAELKASGHKEDSDAYKAQEKVVQDAEKSLQEAQTAQDNFRNSYVNYRKKQVEQLQEQIKLDREMAELSRKMRSQQLDADAYNGARGGNATAEKLALELKNSYELMGEEQRRIRETNAAFFVRNAKGFIKGMGEDAKAVFGAWKTGDYSGVMQQSAAFVKSLGKTLASIDGALKSQDMQLPESRVLEIRKMQMDALKALTDFWQKVVTDMANIVKQSKNAIDDLQINRLREIMRGDRKLNPFDVNNTAAFQRQRGELGALQKKQADLQSKYNAAVADELKQRARIQNAEDAVADADMKRVDAASALGDASRKVKEANDAVAWAGKQYSGALDALARDVHAGESTYHTGTLEAANAAKTELEKRRENLEWAQSNERQAMFAVADAERRYADASDMLSKETAMQTAEKSKAIKNEMDANAKAIAQKQNEIRQGSAMLRYREMERDLANKRNAADKAALAKRSADADLGFRREELDAAKEETAMRTKFAQKSSAEYAEQQKAAMDAGKAFRESYGQFMSKVRDYGNALASEDPNVIATAMDDAAAARAMALDAAKKSHDADEELARRHAESAEAEAKAVQANADEMRKAGEVASAEQRVEKANGAYAKAREEYTAHLNAMRSKEARELQAQARREWILRNGTYEQKGGVLKGVLNSAIVRDQKLIAQSRAELSQGWYADKDGNKVELDEAARAKRIAEINELSQSVRKNMDGYIDVQGDLVKRQQEARSSTLQLAQSLQQFRSVAVDAVDATSSEAFSMRYRSFTGLKELPQMRTTTKEEKSMNENMDRRDEYFTELNKFLADYAAQNGADAQKQYAQAISGLATAANSFKSAVETFDKAVQKPLTVSVSYVDPFAR